jgi:hypothetical protein
MAENFDPYHKWLGIAPNEQPPNHYRLLGLNLFEPDLDVIENGADRQMTHLRSFQTGTRVRECQKLLNEVAKARVVLLNVDKKAAYDHALQMDIAPVQSPPVDSAETPLTPADLFASGRQPALPVPQAAASVFQVVTPNPKSPVVHARRTARRKKSKTGMIMAIGGCLLGLLVGGVILSVVLQDDSEPVVTGETSPDPPPTQPQPEVKPATAVGDPAGQEADPKEPDNGSPPVVPDPKPAVGGESVKGAPGEEPLITDSGPPSAPSVVTDTSPNEPNPGRSLGDLLVPNEVEKLPVPDPSALSSAGDHIRKMFEFDLNKEFTPEESAELASTFIDQAMLLGTEPAESYVLLEIAIDIAAKSSAIGAAAKAFRELDRTFLVDIVQLQADAALQVAQVAKEPQQHMVVVELLESVIDRCIPDERYDLAISLVDVAFEAARKSKISSATMRIADRSRDIRARHAAYEPVRAALQLMADGLDDPAANETVGTYLCLVRGKWDEGLPHMMKTNESALRALAIREMQLPTKPDVQVEVADAWLKMVPDLAPHLRLQAMLRAESWYRLVLAQERGLNQKSLEARISEVGKQVGEVAQLPPGAVLVMTFESKTLKPRGFVRDVSNHGHTGRVYGAVRADGVAGKSLAFDGQKTYVEVATTPWLSAPPTFTIVVWVNVAKWRNLGMAWDYVLSKEDGRSGAKGYILRFSRAGNLDFTFAPTSSWRSVVSEKKVGLGTWFHLATTSDGKVARIYLNGEPIGEGSIAEGIRPSNEPFRIGKSKYHKNSGLNGRIDEVAVFNRALAPDEIRTVYRIGAAGRPLMD